MVCPFGPKVILQVMANHRPKLFTALLITLFLTSCETLRKWEQEKENEESISFEMEEGRTNRKDRSKEKSPEKEKPKEKESPAKVNSNLVERYAKELGVESKDLKNPILYEYIDGWIGVPYKYAGNDKKGVDCSGFVNAVYLDVYKKTLPRSALDIVRECEEVKKDELREGDMVFFDISGRNSHVGIYLVNGKFVHASTSKGVIISDLQQSYYLKYWGRAGRLKN